VKTKSDNSQNAIRWTSPRWSSVNHPSLHHHVSRCSTWFGENDTSADCFALMLILQFFCFPIVGLISMFVLLTQTAFERNLYAKICCLCLLKRLWCYLFPILWNYYAPASPAAGYFSDTFKKINLALYQLKVN
jgi:hypothetical protein